MADTFTSIFRKFDNNSGIQKHIVTLRDWHKEGKTFSMNKIVIAPI
jgi:hypothetical protein